MASILDWLIPSQVRRDISSTRMGVQDWYENIFQPSSSTPAFFDYVYGQNQPEGWEIQYPLSEPIEANPLDPIEWDDLGLQQIPLSVLQMQQVQSEYDKWLGQGTDVFDPESILGGLGGGIGKMYTSEEWGDETPLTPEAVQAFKPSDFRKLHTGYYQDYIAGRRDPLETQLTGNIAKAQSLGSGFAGYGQRGKMEDIAKGSFLEAMQGVYGDVDRYRGRALEDVYGKIGGWEDLMEQFTD